LRPLKKLIDEINFNILIETLVTCTAAYCYVDEELGFLILIISNFIIVCISKKRHMFLNPILALKAKQVYSLSFYVPILSPAN